MWRKILFFLCYVACQVASSHQIKVTCEKLDDLSPEGIIASPSKVAGLNVVQVTKGREIQLNISWAINVDASNRYLTGTCLKISGEPLYLCEYYPSFSKADLTGSEQVWFHFLINAREGFYEIEVFNLPLPPIEGEHEPMYTNIEIIPPPEYLTTTSQQIEVEDNIEFSVQDVTSTDSPPPPAPPPEHRLKAVSVFLVGLLIALTTLSFCCIIYKYCISASLLRVKSLPAVPVSVLVVYPAENSVFQRAVVALAEFLQLHGGCSVTIDMWQQGKIAELGPLRWLTEQAKAADRVLIISPQGETLSQSSPNHNLPEHSIPAAAHDLYPLILNMVASHAKSASELAKFWVVHLHKKSCVFLPELKACRSFCLMKDLNTFCESLHAQKNVGKKISSLLFKPGVSHSKNSTTKLRETIEMLGGCKSNLSNEVLINDMWSV
ncbi:uncharacterized protein il17rb isoform X2 [Austrofundulus limnaeus]|uniref:Uncharacterized protein il17rb isoform X2 n=1 Tax=Austrofundulus limnaeus TaxID=52670 RepID=A0A2I4ANV6_AUSLI|nr:PREDICTED: interleukin-17 receptor B isoform X2 [Austrofundulus limnaeus]